MHAAAALAACPEGKLNPGAWETGSLTTGLARCTSSLMSRAMFQATIIVTNAHRARLR